MMQISTIAIRVLALFLLMGAVTAPGGAKAENLVAALSNTQLVITSDYTGSSLAVFGTIESDAQTVPRVGSYDIVITIRGPRQAMTIREKSAFGFIWLNREQQKFPQAPAFLGVFSSRPIADITSEALRNRLKIGLDAVVGAPDFTNDRDTRDEPFRQALLRLKKQDNLYLQNEKGVVFLTPSLFKASVYIPATAPPGNYEVEIALFVDTALLSRHFSSFELIKSGFEQQVGDIAREWSLAYGLATALLAVFFGWLANVLFRRD